MGGFPPFNEKGDYQQEFEAISTKHKKNCDQMSEVGNAGHEQRQIISAYHIF